MVATGHKKNTELFHKLGGPDLTVKVLDERCTEYDVCNAASVLLCNLLYKNEVMKQHLGTNGAPAALVKVRDIYTVLSNIILFNVNRCIIGYKVFLRKLLFLHFHIPLFVGFGKL